MQQIVDAPGCGSRRTWWSVCEGAPPLRQAFSLTMNSSVSLILPLLSSMEDVFGGHQLGEAGREDQLVGIALVEHAAASRHRSGSRAARRSWASSFFSAAPLCAAPASTSATTAARSAGDEQARQVAKCRSAIIAFARRYARKRRLPRRMRGLAENCGSVKAAAAHEARMAIIAHRGIGGNRRSCRSRRLRASRPRPSGSCGLRRPALGGGSWPSPPSPSAVRPLGRRRDAPGACHRTASK